MGREQKPKVGKYSTRHEIYFMVVFYLLILIFFTEVIFRIAYFFSYGRFYHISIKESLSRSHVTEHPFLSFAYRRNSWIEKNQKLPYPLHTNKYYSFKNPLRLNNLGHFGEDIPVEKPEGEIRIFCLGASTTANNIADNHKDHTYPGYLQSMLEKKYPQLKDSIRVYNCGIGGWVSPDILINFLLNLLHCSPDYVIIYHGYNDLQVFLSDDEFRTDYSHARKNLSSVIHKIRIANFLPKLKFLHFYEYVKDRIFGTGNVRNDVLGLINISEVNYTKEYTKLEYENRLIENIVIMCKHYGIECVLSSFAFYNYKNDFILSKLEEGVRLQNKLRKDTAEKFNLKFVDQSKLIKKDDKYFVDCVHFTPEGMYKLAENFCKEIYLK